MIAIIDYRAGNLTSVKLALAHLGVAAEITQDAGKIREAERVIFPGVGAAGASMKNLAYLGLIPVIKETIGRGTPFLGICVGTQILLERSEEDCGTACLGLLPGNVRRFQPTSFWDKVPQIGWNQVAFTRPHPLLEGVQDGTEFYFVHSYYPAPAAEEHIFGTTGYAGVTFAALLGRENIFATQFHAEKSGPAGLRILENFTRWDGRC